MIILVLVALGATGYFSAAFVREHGSPVRSVFVTSWIVAGVIALARIMILYGSMLLSGVHVSRPIGLPVSSRDGQPRLRDEACDHLDRTIGIYF
jgi:hypothetical protein